MRCSKTKRLLSKYLDFALSERDAREVADHIESCTACGVEARKLTDALSLLRQWDGVEPSRSFKWLESRIEAAKPRSVVARLPVPGWAAATAAAVGIVLGSFAGLQTAERPVASPPSQHLVAAAMDLHTFSVNDVLEASLDEGLAADVQTTGEVQSQ